MPLPTMITPTRRLRHIATNSIYDVLVEDAANITPYRLSSDYAHSILRDMEGHFCVIVSHMLDPKAQMFAPVEEGETA